MVENQASRHTKVGSGIPSSRVLYRVIPLQTACWDKMNVQFDRLFVR